MGGIEGRPVTQYVFDARKVVRYRFPTHTNDLIMDRREASASEAFFVILEPGEAPPVHVHEDAEQVFFTRSRWATSFGRRPVSRTRSGAPDRPGSCT
jgi:hypothetical protein